MMPSQHGRQLFNDRLEPLSLLLRVDFDVVRVDVVLAVEVALHIVCDAVKSEGKFK